jgi:hypothetical protein
MTNKLLVLITVLPYQVAMLMVMLGANYKINQSPVIGKIFNISLKVVAVLFFVFGLVVMFVQLPLIPISISSELTIYHWLSFMMSSQFLSYYSHRLKNKSLVSV